MARHFTYLVLFISGVFVLIRNTNAQVMIRVNYGSATVTSFSDILNFSVENTLPNSMNVQLIITIENTKQGQILQAGSTTININPGPTIFTNELYNHLKITYANTELSKNLSATQIFGQGDYNVCYKIINVNDNNLLGDQCADFSILPSNTFTTDADTSKKRKFVTIHGTSELLFNYSTNQTNFTNLPPTYLNWTFSPQITVWDIPFSGRLFLTTMQLPGQQSMNNFTFNFDAAQFKNILKTKLLELLKKNKTLNKIGSLDFQSYISEYENIKGIFNNPAVLDELKQIGELDSLKNMVNSFKEGVSNIKNTVDGYKDKYEELKNDYKEVKSIFSKDSIIKDSSFTNTLNKTTDPDSLNQKINNLNDSLETINDTLSSIKDKYSNRMDSVKNSLDGYMNDPSKLGYQALDSLKKRIKALEWLESKKVYYDKLLEKKKTIEEYGKKFGLIDSNGNFSTDKFKDINTDKLSDPDYLYTKLKSSKLLRKFDKVLYMVKSLSIGLAAPQYSSLSLNGMAVNGFSIEIEPFKFYGSFTYGTILNPVLTSNSQNASYKRDLYAGKFGYGPKEKTHLHVTILSSTDDSASINPRDSIYLYYKLPQDNKVISIDGQINLFKNKFIISAELSGSQTIKDLTTYSSNNIINGVQQADPNNWLVNIFTQDQNVSKSVVDYAITGKMEVSLFKDKTKISTSFKRIGPNYYSFGLPFLIRDMMTFEVKMSQSLWKNRIQLSGFIRRNEDNLEGTKPQTTQFYNYGFDFSLRIPKWPSFKAGLTPIILQSDTSYFSMIALNINSNYSFRIRKLQNVVSISFMKQMSDANLTSMHFDITYLNFVHSIQFKTGPSVNINASYINSITSSGKKDTWVAGAGTSFTLFKVWSNLLGGNIYINQNELKWGAYWQTNVNIAKYLTLSMRLENNQFNTYLNLPGITNYTQFTCRTSIIAKW